MCGDVLCYVMLCDAMSCCVVLCYVVMLCQTMLCCVVLCYVMSHTPTPHRKGQQQLGCCAHTPHTIIKQIPYGVVIRMNTDLLVSTVDAIPNLGALWRQCVAWSPTPSHVVPWLGIKGF